MLFSRLKLALETSTNFVATRAGKRREFPASVSWALDTEFYSVETVDTCHTH